jgi:probable rRNA maturation factor
VIAFAFEPGTGAWPRGRGVVGDLYVCPPVAAAQARRFGSSPREETRRLLVHGALHLLGWVHAEGRERTTGTMWRRQERLLARLGGAR